MQTEEDFKSGQVICIDKPLNWTSFQVVNKIRWKLKKTFGLKKIKVGHAGTLDPLATGLLIICTGKKTKSINTYQDQTKEYTGIITLGSTTPSYDLETEFDGFYPTTHINESLVQDARKEFIGEIKQYPPIFSAIKKDGKRLYELARAGEKTTLEPRTVRIDNFEITEFKDNQVHFRVVCSKGTYIRSLAHDFGKALGSGGHLSELRRTKIGDFKVEQANSIEAFIEQLDQC